MSHFSVMVIGENPESQLEPFHEFECTGTNDQYVQDVDITTEIRELMTRADAPMSLNDALAEYGLEERIVEQVSDVCRDDAHKFGFAVVRGGELIQAIKRTNPNKRWDWRELGGRYTGRLKLKHPDAAAAVGKPGLLTNAARSGHVDQARKGDIDFEGMMSEKEAAGRERYRRFQSLIAGCDAPKSWAECLLAHPEDTDAARDMYKTQPAIERCISSEEFNLFRFACVVAEFAGTEDDYAQLCRARAVSTFAVVKDSQWYERGRMGWFAMVRDEQDEKLWQRQCAQFLAEASDGALISIFDCHI